MCSGAACERQIIQSKVTQVEIVITRTGCGTLSAQTEQQGKASVDNPAYLHTQLAPIDGWRFMLSEGEECMLCPVTHGSHRYFILFGYTSHARDKSRTRNDD